MVLRHLVVAAGLLGFALPGWGDILFNQTPPPTGPNVQPITDYRVADDFTFSTTSDLTDILFYYAVDGNDADSAVDSDPGTDLGPVTYAIYQNSGGSPGTLIQSELITSGNVTRTGQSGICGTCYSATFSLPTPLILAGGTDYWLELHADTTLIGNNGGDRVYWANVADNFPNSGFIAEFNASPNKPNTQLGSGNHQFAFELSGTPVGVAAVPEPSSIVLLSLVLLSLGLLSSGFGLKRRS